MGQSEQMFYILKNDALNKEQTKGGVLCLCSQMHPSRFVLG